MKHLFMIFLFLSSRWILAASPEATVSDQLQLKAQYESLLFSSPTLYRELNPQQRRQLLRVVMENPVAALSQIPFYDPPQNGQEKGEIGYCYGRAMAAHLLARKMGVQESSLKKIFAAGDMQNQSVRWRFHMATVVLGEDGEYYAIDPIMPILVERYNNETGSQMDPQSPLNSENWIHMVKHFYDNTESILRQLPELRENPNFTGTIKFYVTGTEAIMVDMREVPADLILENGHRLIEVLFQPTVEKGFSPVYSQNQILYYEVFSEVALQEYFTTIEEPLVDQFQFYQMNVDIFYLDANVIRRVTRHYLYNGKKVGEEEFQPFHLGYFPSLIQSVEQYTGVLDHD